MHTIYTVEDLRALNHTPNYGLPRGAVAEYGQETLLRELRAKDYARVEHEAVMFRAFVAGIRAMFRRLGNFVATAGAISRNRPYGSV